MKFLILFLWPKIVISDFLCEIIPNDTVDSVFLAVGVPKANPVLDWAGEAKLKPEAAGELVELLLEPLVLFVKKSKAPPEGFSVESSLGVLNPPNPANMLGPSYKEYK